jgi:hypothetical protein
VMMMGNLPNKEVKHLTLKMILAAMKVNTMKKMKNLNNSNSYCNSRDKLLHYQLKRLSNKLKLMPKKMQRQEQEGT